MLAPVPGARPRNPGPPGPLVGALRGTALWVAALSMPAQATDGFRLLDPDGRPHAGVTVSVVGRAGSVSTDGAGRFRLAPEPRPPFELVVFDDRGTLIGTAAVETLDGAAGRDLVLEPARSERVTVLGGVAPSTPAPPAAAATVVSGVEQRRQRPARLVEVLDELPGAERVGSGPAAVPALRGLARGRTLILLDDARVTAERRAGPSATFLDPFALESVEIVRGPGAVAYGSDALGGVIHARTPAPRPGETGGRFEFSAGEGRPEVSAALEFNAPLGSGALLIQAHGRRASDYDTPDGTVPDSGGRDRGALLRVRVPAGRTKLILGAQADRARDVGKPRDLPTGTRTIYPVEDSDRLTVAADLPGAAGFSSLQLRAFLGRYRLVTDRRSQSFPRTIERADVESRDGSLRLSGSRPLSGGALRAGIDLVSRFDLAAHNLTLQEGAPGSFAKVRDDTAIASARRLDAGMYVELERGLNGLPGSLAGGLRGDHVVTRNRGGAFGDRSTSHDSVSGYVALTYRPVPRVSGTLQAARGFRDPLLSDRYFLGVTGRGTIAGNPALRPETSEQFDASLRWSAGRARVALYGYRYRVRDLIERFRVPGTTDRFGFRNRGAATLSGAELECDVDLPRQLALRATLNYAEGSIAGGGAPNDVPPESAGLSLRRQATRHWWRAGLRGVVRDDDPGDTERTTPGHTVIDLSAGLSLGSRLELRALVRNALDRSYPDSADDRSPPAPGRSLALVLAGTF